MLVNSQSSISGGIMKWHSRKFSVSGWQIPSGCGLYAIGHTIETGGLVTGIEIVYIGQATNLRRRLGQHGPWIEANSALEEYLRQNRARARLWFTTDVTAQGLNEAEREMIRNVNPTFNRIKYEARSSKK